MELLRFLVLVSMVLWPLVNSQDPSSMKTLAAVSPSSSSSVAPSSSSPPDEEAAAAAEDGEGVERSVVRLKTIPSGEEGLQLAIGDTAILECQLSVPLASSHRFKSLSWTDTLTHVTMTTDNVTENSDKTMSVTLSNTSEDDDNRTTTTSLVLTASNFDAVGSAPFRCDAEVAAAKGDEEGKKIQATLNVTLVDPEWFCTFEGKTNCEWKPGKSWKMKQSSAATVAAVGQDNCRDGISDHTYGPSNTVGRYLIAEFISESIPHNFEDTILSRNVRGHALSKCIRFFYRLCQRIPSTDPLTVTIAKEDNATTIVHDIQPGDRWKEFSLPLPPYEKDYQIIIAVKYNNGMYVAIDDIKLESNGICKSEQAVAEVAAELLGGPKSTAVVGTAQAPTQSSTTVSSSSTSSSSSSASSATPPTSQSSVISSSETASHLIPLTAVSEHPSTKGTQTTDTHRPTVSTVTASTSSSTTMQTAIANGLTSPSVASVKTTPVAPTTLSPTSSPQPSSATVAVVSLASAALSSDRPRTEATAIPDVDGTFRPTSQEPGASDNDDDGDDDDDEVGGGGASTADAVTNDNSTGLAIGIILAIMVAGACTAAILYRRRKNGKKSTYITFGNPSYSREHLPVNDFGLDSPLTLSSNGYTVLA